NAIVTLVPILETFPHLRPRSARFKTKESVREIISDVVVLWRKIITLGLALLADQPRLFFVLVHVVGDRPHVVEELRIDRPASVFVPDRFADQRRAAGGDRRAQGEAYFADDDVAQALVRDAALVGRLGGRGEPPLVNTAAIGAVGVGVVRMELEPQAG